MRLSPLATAPVLLLTLALSSCGNEMQAETDANSAEGQAPDCSEVWTEGAVIAADYTGCAQAGSLQPLDAVTCEDGTQLTAFGEEYFAVLGEAVQAGGPDSAEYTEALEACQGA